MMVGLGGGLADECFEAWVFLGGGLCSVIVVFWVGNVGFLFLVESALWRRGLMMGWCLS